MPYYSPLRYPGGKRRLTSAIIQLLEANGLHGVHYAESFAGGSAVALALLIEEYATKVSINDLSRPVFAFWQSVLHQTDELCRRINRTRVTMPEWKRQRAVYDMQDTADLMDLGFATLFLNRTNRSGILGGGVIGGKQQNGLWSLDARFNKTELVSRIRRVAAYRKQIELYRLDALEFTNRVVCEMGRNSLVFYDPPYIEKGAQLYLNNYSISDHQKLASRIKVLRQPWIVTYDNAAVQHGLYESHRRIGYSLHYSAQDRYKGKEAMFISDSLRLPGAWKRSPQFLMTSESSEYPLYGKLERIQQSLAKHR